jgi:AraC-like DNA-binding protein
MCNVNSNYAMIERRSSSQLFAIHSTSEIYERSKGRADVPHRHDYYTALFVSRASGKHFIDYKSFEFGTNELHLVSPGQVHQVVLKEKPKGTVISFSKDFLARNNISEDFIGNLNLFSDFGDTPPIALDNKTMILLKDLERKMQAIQEESINYKERALGAYLQVFLIYCNNCKTIDKKQLDEKGRNVCVFRDFKNLVERNYHKWHKLSEYADEIHLTSKYLSELVKSVSGRTAKQMIQDRIVLEAKRQLLHSTLNINEIAFTLGFSEAEHFSAFFKKCQGVSPKAYRTQHKA